ncbi:MAG: N-acyl homoserine lactonase family protein [Propionibacterium sp.]|nr:N-acyl homoserine lactonase family protein [Propionibacterium sp.]
MTDLRMWAMRPATFQSPGQIELYGRDAAPRMPTPTYLIEHPDGLVLFDAGLNPDHAGDPIGGYGAMAEKLNMDFREEHTIEAHLGELGFGLDDVKVVIASHLHFDHAGALKQFPHATTFIGEGELEYARAPEKFCTGWFHRDEFDDRHGIQWQVLPCDHDVFGDGTVTVLHLPGHTPGSLGALVRLPKNTYILTGDAIHTRAGYASELHYHGDHDTVTARRTLRKIAHLERVTDAGVWICHDPDDWQKYGGAGEKQ